MNMSHYSPGWDWRSTHEWHVFSRCRRNSQLSVVVLGSGGDFMLVVVIYGLTLNQWGVVYFKINYSSDSNASFSIECTEWSSTTLYWQSTEKPKHLLRWIDALKSTHARRMPITNNSTVILEAPNQITNTYSVCASNNIQRKKINIENKKNRAIKMQYARARTENENWQQQQQQQESQPLFIVITGVRSECLIVVCVIHSSSSK